MSTYWDVRCLDCDVESGLHLNHGVDQCRGLVQCRDALAALADSELASVADIDVSVPGERGHVDLSFYKTHAGHVLAAVNEYRQIDGDCNEHGPSYDYVSCPLPDRHEGDHDFEKRSWPEIMKRAAERRR